VSAAHCGGVRGCVEAVRHHLGEMFDDSIDELFRHGLLLPVDGILDPNDADDQLECERRRRLALAAARSLRGRMLDQLIEDLHALRDRAA